MRFEHWMFLVLAIFAIGGYVVGLWFEGKEQARDRELKREEEEYEAWKKQRGM